MWKKFSSRIQTNTTVLPDYFELHISGVGEKSHTGDRGVGGRDGGISHDLLTLRPYCTLHDFWTDTGNVTSTFLSNINPL